MMRALRTVTLSIVLLVIVLALWIGNRYSHDIRQARDAIATGSEVARTACGPIEYAMAGDGPPVLVVHGAGGGFDQGMRFGEALIPRGFRVIAMSRFGYLRTPLPEDASAAAQADAHACLLDALGMERAAVIGISAGGPSSLQFALRHPERIAALVLLVPAVYAPRPGDAPPVHSPLGTQVVFETALRSDFLFWAATRLARESLIRALLATSPELIASASPQEQQRVQRLLNDILPVSPRRLGLINDGAVVAQIPRYPLENITTPTLAISMEDDLFGTFDGARYTAAHIPGARFIGYERGGHVWVGHHEAIVSEVAGFLSGALAPDQK